MTRRRPTTRVAWPACLVGSAVFAAAAPGWGAVRAVGPGKTYAAPCAAFTAAADGDVIEIDAAGSYVGDTCTVARNDLTIRGVGATRARIDAGGKAAAGKGTWVIAGHDTIVENVEMLGAAVPDHNGAAIRQEGANLTVRNAYFHDNENGILAGANAQSEIVIERSEFARNGNCIDPAGCAHNMYIGAVKSFTFRFSYTHGARDGHEIKTRAAENHILYSRISDEADGTASYSVDVPNAGRTFLIGNVIQQGPKTGNPVLVAYGAEGATNPSTELYVVNNTFVNDRAAGGTFINVASGVTTPAVVENNLFVGPGTVISQAAATQAANVTGGDPMLVDPAQYDYRLRPGSPCVNAGVDPGMGAGQPLTPMFEYVHPLSSAPRAAVGALDVGAYELDGPRGDAGAADAARDAVSPADADAADMGGAAGSGGDAGPGSGGGGAPADARPQDTADGQGQAGAQGRPDAGGVGQGSGGGCGCETVPPAPVSGLGAIMLVSLLRRGRRRFRG